jgi:arabinoxylan arabinofuranohydrolase
MKGTFLLVYSLLIIISSNMFSQKWSYNINNEIIRGKGVCDPHISIFNDTAYLFATHDAGPGNKDYTMNDWYLYSSPDLVNWKLEFTLKPENTFIGPWNACYAPDGATRNGKYYFYFSQKQSQTGVAVSDNPKGPYTDLIKKPLLPENLTPTADYDPAIFIDDDPEKTPYILWGYTVVGQSYYIAKLNEDMMSLADAPRKIVIHNSWKNDAVDLHKRNGIYYLNSHEARYATSTNVYGPYTFKGVQTYDGLYTKIYCDHGNFFNWKNQTYHSYGVRVDTLDPYYRTTKITYLHYKDNGDLVADDFFATSNLGVGQYDAKWPTIQAEWFFEASNGLVKKETKNGFGIHNITDNSYLHFPKLQNLSKSSVFNFYISSTNKKKCSIEIREGGIDGKLLGKCKISDTGSLDIYKNFSCNVKNISSTADIYFVFKGKEKDKELFRFDWFKTTESLKN